MLQRLLERLELVEPSLKALGQLLRAWQMPRRWQICCAQSKPVGCKAGTFCIARLAVLCPVRRKLRW